MEKARILTLIISILLILTACTSTKNEVAVPASSISIEDVTNINLKVLDLSKMNKQNLEDFNGLILSDFEAQGYQLEYRFFDKSIKVAMIKFPENTNSKKFWKSYIENCLNNTTIQEKSEIATNSAYLKGDDNQNCFYNWFKNEWFFSVSVPSKTKDSEQMRDKVKDVITNHFLALNQKK